MKTKTKKPAIALKTRADYAKIFNDIGAALYGSGGVPSIHESDVLLLNESRVSVRMTLGLLGSAVLDLDRKEFERTANKMFKLLIQQQARIQQDVRRAGRAI